MSSPNLDCTDREPPVDIRKAVASTLRDIGYFSQLYRRLKLRAYQGEVARAVVESVLKGQGMTFVIQFPRQSGKNELQAQIETYLLTIFSRLDGEIVKVSPTWKPQTLNAMRRLERVLERNLLTRGRWQKEAGYIFRTGNARIFFLSGSPTANVVGATASTMLVCDEAQDVLISKWDKDFAPMAASTNATRVFWGTAWTSRTLLARELRAAKAAQAKDGKQRVFVIGADEVAKEVPAYGEFVREQVAKLGRSHPLVRTQYYGEEIDAEGGMFPESRRALMWGTHEAQLQPEEGKMYALLIDVAGEDEAGASLRDASDGLIVFELANSGRAGAALRDATACTIVEMDLVTVRDDLVRAPTYRVMQRKQWVGVKHSSLYGELRGLAEHWRARWVVVDATGVGAGLASFLEKALPGKVIPFVFSAGSKSKLGWDFLAVIDSGRFKDHRPDRDSAAGQDLQDEFFRQAGFCQYEVVEGPGKVLRWSVPDGTRDPETGELLHDDLLISAALCAVLDRQDWTFGEARSEVIEPEDPLEGLTW
jgi:hypothetical protein